MNEEFNFRVSGTIDVLLDYKNGHLNLATAADRFSALTGMDRNIAEKFIRGMTRQNVLPLSNKSKLDHKPQSDGARLNVPKYKSGFLASERNNFMANGGFNGSSALLAHMLEGHQVSLLEAMIIFGVQSPNAEFGRMKKAGHLIQRQRVPMAKILRRMNQHCTVEPPSELPVREIAMTEYWISQ